MGLEFTLIEKESKIENDRNGINTPKGNMVQYVTC